MDPIKAGLVITRADPAAAVAAMVAAARRGAPMLWRAVAGLAPGRLRLGIGPSHKFIIQDMYGIPFDRPLEHLREYVTVLRGLLWDGKVDFQGAHFRVKARLAGGAAPPRVPLPIAALRPPSFRLA